MHDSSFEADLDSLRQLTPPKRGSVFEGFVARLYKREHFTVMSATRAAAPRQADLVATRSKETYLVEAKWITRRVNVGNIDSLLTRLHSTDTSVIGVLFSMSGFTTTAIKQVRANAHRPILLFDEHDVEWIVRRPGRLSEMLRSKRDALVLQRHVELGNTQLEPGHSHEERTQRTWPRRDGALRDSLIAGVALVIGAALAWGGTVLSVESGRRSAQRTEVLQVCSAYATALVVSADEADSYVAKMMLTGGWTKREVDRITTELEDGLVPIVTDLDRVELLVNSEMIVKDATEGLNDYREMITDLEADRSGFEARTVYNDADRVKHDATQFASACRNDHEASLPTT